MDQADEGNMLKGKDAVIRIIEVYGCVIQEQ